MAMYSNIHELGSLLVVESENDSGDLKSILDVNSQMPKVEDICWCTNGILFAYHDLLYSIGDGPNGCDAIRM